MKTQLPRKRRYQSRGCARCGGYGVIITYEQNFVSHNDMLQAFGRWKGGAVDSTVSLRDHVGFVVARAVPMLCPACRNAPEAVTR